MQNITTTVLKIYYLLEDVIKENAEFQQRYLKNVSFSFSSKNSERFDNEQLVTCGTQVL